MVHGHYFDARHTHLVEATLSATAGGQWRFEMGGAVQEYDPAEVKVSHRVGNIPRRLHLPDGAEFETRDNDGIDALLHMPGARRGGGFVHALERRWPVALAALVAVGLVSFAMLTWGLPVLAQWAAHRVPPAADEAIGAQVLQILDRAMLEPTQLPGARRAHLQQVFRGMTQDLGDGHRYRLELRDTAMGANALALPSGIILLTDDLVSMAENDEELMAVIAHEIGHVRGRHSLRLMIQNAGVSALALVLLGDVGTVTSVVASAGPLMMQMRYSRDIEREADAFSRQWLEGQGIDARHFDRILCRMVGADEGQEPPLFFASHPPSGERVRCDAEGAVEDGAGMSR